MKKNTISTLLLVAFATLNFSAQESTNESTNESILYYSHMVKGSENVASISARYGVSQDNLIFHNNLDPNKEIEKKYIKIPYKAYVKSAEKFMLQIIDGTKSLYEFAKEHKVTVAMLKRINGDSTSFFKVGQLAVIPDADYKRKALLKRLIAAD